jgi:hypothetical protein
MPERPHRFSAFLREHFVVLLTVSAILLVPCFWHSHIEAGDLASHTYNAWLTSLIEQGKAPGLWISSQTNNILVDILLFRMGSTVGWAAGEKVVVCIVVLVFFWGAFSLAGVASGRAPWFLVPSLAMLAYGWTLNMGFLNFYFSLGLSFIGLAFLWRGRRFDFLYALGLLPLIWMAHPLGFAWFGATALYILSARFVKGIYQWALFVAAVVIMWSIRWYLVRNYRVEGTHVPFIFLNGGDQIVLGKRYILLFIFLMFSVLGCAWLDLARFARKFLRSQFPLPLNLFVTTLIGLALIPDVIWFPRYSAPVTAIVFRFTLALGVLGCCVLAGLRVRRLFAILTAAIALAYFGLLFVDTAKADAMETQADSLVKQVPGGAHVIVTFLPLSNLRIFAHHVVDRACVGHCFVLDNYEPASKQFRVRANVGNRIAEADSKIVERMMVGDYVVTQDDLPAWQISECRAEKANLCLKQLKPGPLLHSD